MSKTALNEIAATLNPADEKDGILIRSLFEIAVNKIR